MTNGSLKKVERIAECSFWPALSDNWYWNPILDFVLSGRLRQVLLLIGLSTAKFLLKDVDVVHFSNDHNIVKSLICRH